jgi:WhiB family redox-sensing transcriptional regulator
MVSHLTVIEDGARWQDQAACRGLDPNPFFPGRGETPEAAKEVCAVCPARAACLEHSIVHREHRGVWGGLSAEERRQLRRTPAQTG